jgi:hypothetical protein
MAAAGAALPAVLVAQARAQPTAGAQSNDTTTARKAARAADVPISIQRQTAVVNARAMGAFGRLNTEDFTHTTAVDASPERTWAVLKEVYQVLKLPVNTMVDRDRRIGVEAKRFRTKIGGERSSRVVSCGRASDGQEAADSYEVMLDVMSTVIPNPDGVGATIVSALGGDAKPVYTSGDPVRCMSTGRLEERIGEMVRNRIAANP